MQWLRTALHRMWTATVIVARNVCCTHENKTRTGMKYSWETRDWNPVRRVRYPAIPLADVVKLGITRDSYSRIAVRIRRPLRHSSIMIWGQNKFLVMWTYGNMRSWHCIPSSYKGITAVSGTAYRGSNPREGTVLNKPGCMITYDSMHMIVRNEIISQFRFDIVQIMWYYSNCPQWKHCEQHLLNRVGKPAFGALVQR